MRDEEKSKYSMVNSCGMMEDVIAIYFDKANKTIGRAESNLGDGDIDTAVNRAYYAVFYIMTAMMLARGDVFSSHKQLITNFNKTYIKTGLLPKEYGAKISKCQRLRRQGDYEPCPDISHQDAKEQIEFANDLYHKSMALNQRKSETELGNNSAESADTIEDSNV